MSFTGAHLSYLPSGPQPHRIPCWAISGHQRQPEKWEAPSPFLRLIPPKWDLCPPPHSFKAGRSPSPAPALAQETWSLLALGPARTRQHHHLGQLVAGGSSQQTDAPHCREPLPWGAVSEGYTVVAHASETQLRGAGLGEGPWHRPLGRRLRSSPHKPSAGTPL